MSFLALFQRPALRWLLRRRAVYRWGSRVIILLGLVALLADFLAGSRPLYCQYSGRHHMPVVEAWIVGTGAITWPEEFHRNTWHDLPYDNVVFPPVPYSPGDLHLKGRQNLSPWGNQPVSSWRYRHWLGTDHLGRDVLAGMIHGTRSALLVGLFGTGIALIIGIWLGGMAGYYGDDRLKAGPICLMGIFVGTILGVFLSVQLIRHPAGREGPTWLVLSGALLMLVLWIFGFARIGRWIDGQLQTRTFRVPLDLILMRIVEAVQSLPGLLLLLALVPLFTVPSIWNVVIIVGLIRWPGFARFVRGELLKIREMPYLEAAWLAGIPHPRILWRHALPNALQPVLVLVAFGISSGVLIEAFLSFLGLGVPADDVTWGTLLNMARKQFSDWWLAVFPGLGIFITVAAFNLFGEAVQDSLDERQPYLPDRKRDRGDGSA